MISRPWAKVLAVLAACVALGVVPEAHADGELFAISGAGASSGLRGGGSGADSAFLYTIDPTTGSVVDSIGPITVADSIQAHVTGLSFSPTSGKLYAIKNSDAVSNSPARLMEVDPATGRATQIGPDLFFDGGNSPDMAFSANGTLFAWNEGDDDLYRVDVVTGLTTRVGEAGFSTAQTGLAFRHDDVLFMKATTRLFTVSLITGATTLVDSIPAGSSKSALCIDENGTLFTVDATLHLATIDRATNTVVSLNPPASPQISALTFRPDPALPPATAAAGADVTVTANLRGAPTNVRLFFRRGGDSGFQVLTMSSTLRTNTFAATIPGTNLTPRGVQYHVQADFSGNVIDLPEGAPTTSFGNLSVTFGSFPLTPLPAGTHVLRGVPVAAGVPSAEAVFDELGPYNPKVWRYGTFDPAQGIYLEPPVAPGPRPGQGFWIIAKNATSPAVGGRSTDLSGNFTITLRPGFNQVANPFNFAVDVADLIIPTGVESNFFSFSGGGYVPGNTVLVPETGYFVRNNATTDLTLEIPPVGASAAAKRAPAVPLALADGESGWSVEVHAEAAGFWDAENRFGVRAGATSARDPFDFADAPCPPSGYAGVSFVAEDGLPLLTDYRAAASGGATWKLVFRSDQKGEDYRVRFVPDRPLPDEWRLIALEERGIREIDLGATHEITGRVGSDSFSRTWTVAAGTPAYLESTRDAVRATVNAFALGPVVPNPARSGSGVSLDLDVPRRVATRIEIHDVAGRLVRTILDGSSDQGAHRLTWDGTDNAGHRIGAGVYFVRVRAGEFTASRKVVLLN